MSYETHTFVIPRKVKHVRRNLRLTDEWVPLMFSRMYDGKRVAGNAGEVGAKYKARYYEITTSFAKDRTETFHISEFSEESGLIELQYQPSQAELAYWELPEEARFKVEWKELSKRETEVKLTQCALPEAGMATTLLYAVCKCQGHPKTQARQYRNDCHEEFKALMSM